MTTVNRYVWRPEDSAIIEAAAAAAWSAALRLLPNGGTIWNKWKYEDVEAGARDAVGHVVGMALTRKRPRVNTRDLRGRAMNAALNALATPEVLAVIARVYTEVQAMGETTEKAHGRVRAVVSLALYENMTKGGHH